MSQGVYEEIVERIIKGQETIIGPVAVEQAKRVPHLKVDWDTHEIAIEGDQAAAVDALVEIYKELFGQISVEVSKEAVSSLISKLAPAQVPEMLK
jgi:hypothetical protein